MPKSVRPFVLESLDRRAMYSANVLGPIAPAATTVMPAAVTVRRVFLTGNSLTDGVSYGGLTNLLGRDGATLSFGRQTGSGYSQYDNLSLRTGYATSGVDPARSGVVNPWGDYQHAFAAGKWDVLTIQPHDRRLLHDAYTEPTPHDEAEIPNAMAWLKVMAANNTKGQVFVYSRAARRTDVAADGVTPTGQSFDYTTEWNKTYDEAAPPNSGLPYFSRSRTLQIMSRLRTAQRADAMTAALPPVRLIPAGEAYANVDKMIKAGQFNGTAVHSMLDLYRDQSHPTPDVAAYLTALTFYSSITGHDPRGVAPPSAYLASGSRVADPKVQKLLQQAVYDAITASVYAGYTTPLDTTPPATGTAVFRGYVINDKNANGTWDGGEAGVAGRKVWLDLDNDGTLDANEPTQLTAKNGLFEFKNLAAGNVYVREVLPSGVKQTSPTKNAALTAKLTAGQTKSGQYFATK